MARKFIKRIMPDQQKIRENKSLQIFGPVINNSNLWHLNRRSARGAFAVGLFFAFWPVPFQMVLAAAVAIVWKVNLPLSVALVWITNPVTMPVIFYGAYLVGDFFLGSLLGTRGQAFVFEPTWQWVIDSLSSIGPTFLFGCLICGILFGVLAYFFIDLLWRWSVTKEWKQRNKMSSNK